MGMQQTLKQLACTFREDRGKTALLRESQRRQSSVRHFSIASLSFLAVSLPSSRDNWNPLTLHRRVS